MSTAIKVRGRCIRRRVTERVRFVGHRYPSNYDEAGHDSGNSGGRAAGQAATNPHVFSVAVVKSSCFYGYNPTDEPFLRVTMYARALDASPPRHLHRVAGRACG